MRALIIGTLAIKQQTVCLLCSQEDRFSFSHERAPQGRSGRAFMCRFKMCRLGKLIGSALRQLSLHVGIAFIATSFFLTVTVIGVNLVVSDLLVKRLVMVTPRVCSESSGSNESVHHSDRNGSDQKDGHEHPSHRKDAVVGQGRLAVTVNQEPHHDSPRNSTRHTGFGNRPDIC